MTLSQKDLFLQKSRNSFFDGVGFHGFQFIPNGIHSFSIIMTSPAQMNAVKDTDPKYSAFFHHADDRLRIAQIVRSGRKQLGLSQKEMSFRLGITQGFFSKLESAMMIPTALFWVQFCELCEIPADSIQSGVIDRLSFHSSKDQNYFSNFSIPEKYRSHHGLRVRYFLPLLEHATKTLGYSAAMKTIVQTGVDPDYLIDLDHELGLPWLLDWVEVLESKKIKASSFYKSGALIAATAPAQGRLYANLSHANTVEIGLRRVIEHQPRYESLFHSSFKAEKANEFLVTKKPNAADLKFMRGASRAEKLCEYDRGVLQAWTGKLSFEHSKVSAVKKTACIHHGDSHCSYRIRA
jgi:transcriptional regulator with XRE-family HTH domain